MAAMVNVWDGIWGRWANPEFATGRPAGRTRRLSPVPLRILKPRAVPGRMELAFRYRLSAVIPAKAGIQ
jgi:hypothetical protein